MLTHDDLIEHDAAAQHRVGAVLPVGQPIIDITYPSWLGFFFFVQASC